MLPGYVGLYAADLIVPAPDRTTFQLIIRSLFLSLAGAALAAMLVPAEYLAHLFGNASLSTRDLLGIGFHIVACVGVGIGWALFVKHVLKHQLSRQRSAFPTAWDALWSEHASEHRHVVVELANGRYFGGVLAQADDPRIGRDLLLRAPHEWDKKRGAYVSLNAEFTYIPADQVRRIDIGRVTQPTTGAQVDAQRQRTAGQQADRDEGSQNGRHIRQEPTQHLPGPEGPGRPRAAESRQPDADREPRARDGAAGD